LPFHDKSFEIVFSRWIAQNIDKLEKAVKEMCRVAKSNIIIVLPSEEGDETKMLEIKFPDKFECRKKRIINIKKWISKCDFKIKEKRKLLKFLFPDTDETIEILSALSFNNVLSIKDKLKLREFLSNRKKKNGFHLTQGASFICGTRDI
jgi:ubiquinone/menaquinone biosynthesis C-methylase UbiE